MVVLTVLGSHVFTHHRISLLWLMVSLDLAVPPCIQRFHPVQWMQPRPCNNPLLCQAGLTLPAVPSPCACGGPGCRPSSKADQCSAPSCLECLEESKWSKANHLWNACCKKSKAQLTIYLHGSWTGSGCQCGMKKAREVGGHVGDEHDGSRFSLRPKDFSHGCSTITSSSRPRPIGFWPSWVSIVVRGMVRQAIDWTLGQNIKSMEKNMQQARRSDCVGWSHKDRNTELESFWGTGDNVVVDYTYVALR